LRHDTVADEERWKDRSDQRESHWHSPFENRAAAADIYVDRFCDDFAWCEALGHRSIPQWWRMQLRKTQQRQMFNFLSNASLQLALNVSDKSHGREVGWLAPPVQLNTSLCFGCRCYRAPDRKADRMT